MRGKKAADLFEKGYNCAQAVSVAFCDLTGLTEQQAAMAASSFGGGFGRQREVCGAVSGMVAVAGLVFAKSENTPENKKTTYEIVRELCEKFQAENGSLICADLLSGANLQVTVGGEAEQRTESYYKKRPCAELVYSAADILEKYLIDKGII